jgi:hypothetical protein
MIMLHQRASESPRKLLNNMEGLLVMLDIKVMERVSQYLGKLRVFMTPHLRPQRRSGQITITVIIFRVS